jgi:putative redox protein
LITCYSKLVNFETWFTNGEHEGHCDVPMDKGGGDSSFNPQEFLQAALAGCLNITLRIYAAEHKIPLSGIMTQVNLERPTPDETVFRYALELKGPLTEDQRRELIEATHTCQVHQIMGGKISFVCESS